MDEKEGRGFHTLARYLLSLWAGFDELMRSEDERIIKAYFHRLVALDTVPGVTASSKACPTRVAWNHSKLWKTLVKRGRTIAIILKVVTLVPVLVIQGYNLRRIQKSAQESSVLILGIASNRLPLSPCVKSARENLAALARPLGNTSRCGIADQIMSADLILLFDPLPRSRFWEQRQRCWKETILIIDGAFLLMTLLLALLGDFRRVFGECVAFYQECYSVLMLKSGQRVKAMKRAALCTWVAQGYSLICEGFSKTKAVFFTRNAILLDLLRGYLIYARHCQWICEVMHGVGSEREEQWFSKMLTEAAEFGACEKHVFVPQIPDLPPFGIFDKQKAFGNGTAINAYVNKVLLDLSECHHELGAFIESEYRSICAPEQPSGDRIIVTVFGTYWEEPTFFESPAFKAECMLMTLLAQLKSGLGLKCLIIYVPHPKNPLSEFHHPLFHNNQVRVYRRSIVCWLMTDLAVSLYSCAMFEATYFGARAFTPLTPGDNLFVPYLDLVSHPGSGSFDDLINSLRDCLLGCAKDSRPEVVKKARERLLKIGSHHLALQAHE